MVPLQIPLKRRLQMLAVVLHTLNFSAMPVLCSVLWLYVLLATSFWWLAIGYFTWMLYDVLVLDTSSRGGRRAQWLRKSKLYEYFRDYFPISLIKVSELVFDDIRAC